MSQTWHGRSAAVLIALFMATGCDRQTDAIEADKPVDRSTLGLSHVETAPCARSAPKLSLTQLCPEAATALMQIPPGSAAAAPEGCRWTPGEVALSSQEALLYQAARCGSRFAKLAYHPDKPFVRFTLTASPYEEPIDSMDVIARMTPAGSQEDLLRIARGFVGDTDERARCQVRRAEMEGWPKDALVIDEVPAPPADGVRSACGELGLDEDAQTFWRLSQGRAWFFQLGQEVPVVDARSFTLVHKDGNDHWRRQ
jgi:hypothetical protein